MKTTCKKSWPVDISQVSNSIFGLCFKVKLGHHTKMAIYLFYIGPWAWNSHNERIKYVNPPFFNYMKVLTSDNILWVLYASSAKVVPYIFPNLSVVANLVIPAGWRFMPAEACYFFVSRR